MPEIEFPTILAGEGYEYGVMMRRRPGLHRGPWTEAEARAWVQECVDDGVAPDAFYLVRRKVTAWEATP